MRVPWRCAKCGRLLAKLDLRPGSSAETVCPKCCAVNTLAVAEPEHDAKVLVLSGA